ncbi:hypothetical protein SAY86_017248 [Trapa natans]|uniref:Uncharacterized protein n=1 Tax=Trapa natans TaxID=22666 RepID=A0AAN7LRQ5_TRANT|nr:hypothetical protein SAY86_017248 [Trapa natans]
MTEDSQGRDDPSFLWIEKKEKEKVEGMSTFEQQPPQSLPQPQTQTTTPRSRKQLMLQQSSGSLSFNSNISMEEEEMSMTALSAFRAKEDEIEKWKMEVKERVLSQLGRVEEETKRLATIREVIRLPRQFLSSVLSFVLFSFSPCHDISETLEPTWRLTSQDLLV